MKWSNTIIFIILSVAYIGLSYISSVILDLSGVMVRSLSEQLTAEQIEKVLSFKDQWQWISYVSVPLLLLIKISVIAVLIDVGCEFYNEKLPYKQLFRIALLGEFVFRSTYFQTLLVFIFSTQFLFRRYTVLLSAFSSKYHRL